MKNKWTVRYWPQNPRNQTTKEAASRAEAASMARDMIGSEPTGEPCGMVTIEKNGEQVATAKCTAKRLNWI